MQRVGPVPACYVRIGEDVFMLDHTRKEITISPHDMLPTDVPPYADFSLGAPAMRSQSHYGAATNTLSLRPDRLTLMRQLQKESLLPGLEEPTPRLVYPIHTLLLQSPTTSPLLFHGDATVSEEAASSTLEASAEHTAASSSLMDDRPLSRTPLQHHHLHHQQQPKTQNRNKYQQSQHRDRETVSDPTLSLFKNRGAVRPSPSPSSIAYDSGSVPHAQRRLRNSHESPSSSMSSQEHSNSSGATHRNAMLPPERSRSVGNIGCESDSRERQGDDEDLELTTGSRCCDRTTQLRTLYHLTQNDDRGCSQRQSQNHSQSHNHSHKHSWE